MAKPGAARSAADTSALREGLVIASYGRHCLVELPDGERVICHPRGKKSQTVVGDRVRWKPSEDEGTIEKVDPRRNLFYRQDEIRTKSFAANLDQVLILIAAEPEFSEHQLARALIAAEAERITPIIALNKSDLVEPFERAWARLRPTVACTTACCRCRWWPPPRPIAPPCSSSCTARRRWCWALQARARAR